MRSVQRMAALLFVLATSLSLGCNTLASGRKYTLAKVDRDFRLVEPHRLLERSPHDDLDLVNPTGNWGIKLNGGFLPYLEAVENPEVVIFVSVRIREPNEPEESLLWERVYLNSELEEDHVVLDKDSFFPREDISLLPPIVYEGQDIFIQIRIIELDQEDNERTRQLVNTAASAAVAFRPETGVAVSVFQTALTFLTENNADDIEFQYDFALSQTPGPIDYRGRRYDNVLNPRVGKYVVVKTEHRNRTNYPQGYLATAHHGLRYAGAEIFRWGTLGLLDWGLWNKERADRYQWLFQYPFRVPEASWQAPVWRPNEDRHLTCQEGEELHLIGGRLVGVPTDPKKTDHFYEEQGYLVFSIYDTLLGVDVKSLADLANEKKIVEELGLATSHMSIDDRAKHLGLVTKTIEKLAQKRVLRKNFLERLARADESEIAGLRGEYENQKSKILEESEEDRNELDAFIRDRIERRRRTAAREESRAKVREAESATGIPLSSVNRLVMRRQSAGEKPTVKVGYLLEPGSSDADSIRFEAVRADGSSGPTLIPSALEESMLGPMVVGAVTLEANNADTDPKATPSPGTGADAEQEKKKPDEKEEGPAALPPGAYELIVTRRTSDGVQVLVRKFWLTETPELDEITSDADGKTSLRGQDWEAKAKAYLRGTHLDFVEKVRLELDGGATRVLTVKREGDQIWIENDSEKELVIESATLIMVDREFFADLEGKLRLKPPAEDKEPATPDPIEAEDETTETPPEGSSSGTT